MDDRELLELASKAAGYVLDSDCERIDIRQNSGAPMPWNPLTDDGDAFRLFHLLYAKSDLSTRIGLLDAVWRDTLEETRLEIVRAAAEIGESLNK